MALINTKTENMLNRGGNSAMLAFGMKNLGTILRNITGGITKRTHINKVLASGDVSDGVITLTLDSAYDAFNGVMVVSSAGAVRAITNVAITSTGGVYKLVVSATSSVATDIINADVIKVG